VGVSCRQVRAGALDWGRVAGGPTGTLRVVVADGLERREDRIDRTKGGSRMCLSRLGRLGVLALVVVFATGCSTVARVSVDSAGGDADGVSIDASVSGDGRWVAFSSNANDLVPGDGNPGFDVFVRNVEEGRTTRVSVDIGGGDPNGESGAPSISADGRYVAFQSNASDLVQGDGNSTTDVFVRDLKRQRTSRISVDALRADPNGASFEPSISANARNIAFFSNASDLVSGDTNSATDVFVRDRKNHVTTLVTVDSMGGVPTFNNLAPLSISSTGRYVTFSSNANDHVPDDNNPGYDVFLRDLKKGITTRVSVDTAGGDPNNDSLAPSISATGRYVAFFSWASDLIPTDNSLRADVFVRDLEMETTTRVSVDIAGGDADDGSFTPSISGDGRFVAFTSFAGDLVPGDGNFASDVFVRDLQSGVTIRASVDRTGSDANGPSEQPSMNTDGQSVAFRSDASDLVPGDGNSATDVFVRVAQAPIDGSLAADTIIY
jgi:Tol biopolymer transport system component